MTLCEALTAVPAAVGDRPRGGATKPKGPITNPAALRPREELLLALAAPSPSSRTPMSEPRVFAIER